MAGDTAGTDERRAAEDGSARTSLTAPRTSLSAQAREAVRQRIVDRRYPMGSRLVEREVAEELRMSRVPVREALRALVAEGLLELLPHSGVRVRRLEREDVHHLYEVWEPLAVQASRLAARRVAAAAGETQGVAELRALIARAERAAETGEGEREVAAHTAFHEEIVALAGNPLLVRTMEQLGWQLQLLFGMREEPAHMRAQHAEMLRHIAAGDEESAAASTFLHVRDSRAVALHSLFGDALYTKG
ncbi:GntR family transcriptional regulator [Streptomyces spiroverticillatus]|uniref:GntR family transcriptional regulator n=1 Tax=Streptomyces finlayi TaxID=67296 RepID=A0A918X438_9ACTN|nr:GntR family transcriptional regulator [Streptomyces finlayi]GHA27102.1 GntR family transcriptional regulator [Streptomyces spiroverticillatus]GHD08358.1 GntR family transcriptional regulator [Streptomyces finlayi]